MQEFKKKKKINHLKNVALCNNYTYSDHIEHHIDTDIEYRLFENPSRPPEIGSIGNWFTSLSKKTKKIISPNILVYLNVAYWCSLRWINLISLPTQLLHWIAWSLLPPDGHNICDWHILSTGIMLILTKYRWDHFKNHICK